MLLNGVSLGAIASQLSGGTIPPDPEADFFVTSDAEFVTANANATAGQIIQLQDAGTFTTLTLTNATGVTVRGQTPRVPVVRSFVCSGCQNATIRDFTVQANTMPERPPLPSVNEKLVLFQGNVDGLLIENLRIRGGNPWDDFKDFDPTITDPSQMGESGDWGTDNDYAFKLWTGIGSSGAPSGSITIQNCEVSDVAEAIKFSYGGGGWIRILGNKVYRFYQDAIAFGVGAWNSAPVDGIEVCGNEGWDAFAQPQDNRNPHGDFIQFWTDDVLPDVYEHPIPNFLIAGNVYWFTPGARGQVQRIFISDFMDGYPIIAPVVVDNLLIGRITSSGLTIDAVDNVQSGAVWGYIYRNTILSNPQHNAPIQNELYTNTVSGIGAETGTSLSSIRVRNDPTYPDPVNWIADNITELIVPDAHHIIRGNVITGRGSNATSYGERANPVTSGEWDALANAEDYFAAFQTEANIGKGAGIAGASASEIMAAWADPNTRPWDQLPSWVGWRDLVGVELDEVITTEWAFVHAGGPGASRSLAISGGEYQLADDHEGAGAGSWTSASGSVAHGKYMRVRQTSPDEELTEGTVTLTIGSDQIEWTVLTQSMAEYAIVAFDGADRFFRSDPLGSDGRYCTIGFKMKFPDGAPESTTYIFTGLGSGPTFSAASAAVRVSLLNTGFIRVDVFNSDGTYICTLNMTTTTALCDGKVHEVLLDIDMEQATSGDGRQIWIDGVDRTAATGTWAGGPDVSIGYSRATGLSGFSIGGIGALMLSDVEMHYFYLNVAERAGVHNGAVRARFDASAIGADGSGVTGNQPHTFVTGVAAQWNAVGGINWGSNGKYIAASGSAVTDVSGDPWP